MTAILFGSIGSLADTSELQRDAFNQAFKQHGLDWEWSQAEYQELLHSNGGASRISAYAESRGEEVDAAAVHSTKSQLFQARLHDGGISPRPGVTAVIEAARTAGAKVALVTTTSPENLSALATALAPELDLAGFDLQLSAEDVAEPKPAGDVYALALERLGEQAADVVAIEDNVGGVQAATAAGISVIAFPGENNAGGEFAAAERRVAELSPEDLPVLSGSERS